MKIISSAVLIAGLILSAGAASAAPLPVYQNSSTALQHVSEHGIFVGTVSKIFSFPDTGDVAIQVKGAGQDPTFYAIIHSNHVGDFTDLQALVGKRVGFRGKLLKGPKGNLKIRLQKSSQILLTGV